MSLAGERRLEDVRLRLALKPRLGIPLHTVAQCSPGKVIVYSTQHWPGSIMYLIGQNPFFGVVVVNILWEKKGSLIV